MPGENEQPTEPQVPPVPTVEELVAKMKKQGEDYETLQNQFRDISSANERLTQLLEAAAKRGEPAPTPSEKRALAKDFATAYNIPNEAVLEIIEEAQNRTIQQVTGMWQQAEALRETAREFYEKNPDLRDHKSIVQAHVNDLRTKEPNLTVQQSLDKTAKTVREYIKSIQDKHGSGGGEVPPVVLPGGGVRQPNSGGAPEVPMTPDQELQQDLKERRDRQAKAVGGAR